MLLFVARILDWGIAVWVSSTWLCGPLVLHVASVREKRGPSHINAEEFASRNTSPEARIVLFLLRIQMQDPIIWISYFH
jgi:hypothetical protein